MTHNGRPNRNSKALATRAVWQELLKADPDALVSQTPEWVDAICAAGPFVDVSRQYQRFDGTRMVLPLVQSVVTGARASNPPGWGPGGLLSEGPVSRFDLVTVLQDLSRHRLVSIRPSPLGASSGESLEVPGFGAVNHVSHILDLSGGFDAVWRTRFSSSTRTKVRRAARSGIDIDCDSSMESLAVFSDIYDRWLTERSRGRGIPSLVALQLGHRREPRKKLEAVRSALGSRFRFWIARLDGVPVAAAVSIIHKRHAVYWRGYSSREAAGSVRVNDLLQRHMIEAACESGCDQYHMGESGGVESLVHFKERFGARPYSSARWVREPKTVARARTAAVKTRASIERAIVRRR